VFDKLDGLLWKLLLFMTKAPLTGLNSPSIFMLLTVPRRRPSVFLRCMSMLFHTVLVTLLCPLLFSCIRLVSSPLPLVLFFYPPPHFPGLMSPSPVPFDDMGLLFNYLFDKCFLLVHCRLLIVYSYVWFKWLACSCSSALCPALFLFGVLLGSLPLPLVAGSGGSCVHWTPPFLYLLILFIIFCAVLHVSLSLNTYLYLSCKELNKRMYFQGTFSVNILQMWLNSNNGKHWNGFIHCNYSLLFILTSHKKTL
jgi:hypothetical protein